MFAARTPPIPVAYRPGLVAALLISLATVLFFIAALGVVFLPPEISRWINAQYVSVTHCLDMGAGRPLVTLYWTMGRHGAVGWEHHLAIQSAEEPIPPLDKTFPTALDRPDRKPLSLAKGPASDQALVGNWDGTIFSLDVRQENATPEFLGQQEDGGVVALTSSADGEWIVSQGAFYLHGWNVALRTERWRRIDVAPYCFAVRPDSTTAILGNHSGELIEIDLASGQTLRTLAAAGKPLLTISLSPSGDTLALVRTDGEILLLDSHSGASRWHVPSPAHSHKCQTAAGRIASFSPCGTLLVTAGRKDGKALTVWNVDTGEPLRQLDGHQNIVIGAAFNDRGRLRSWGADGAIRTWNLDASTRPHVATITPTTDAI